jgi:hypothetical protein
VRGEADQFIRLQFQGPGRAPPWAGSNRPSATSRASSLPKSLQSAPGRGSSLSAASGYRAEAPFGPVDGRAAHANAGDDVLVAGAGVGRHQNLRPLELAHRTLAAAQKPPRVRRARPTCSNTSASAHRRLTIWCLTLESAGFIRRQPGVARSIEMLVDPDLNRQRAANRLPE